MLTGLSNITKNIKLGTFKLLQVWSRLTINEIYNRYKYTMLIVFKFYVNCYICTFFFLGHLRMFGDRQEVTGERFNHVYVLWFFLLLFYLNLGYVYVTNIYLLWSFSWLLLKLWWSVCFGYGLALLPYFPTHTPSSQSLPFTFLARIKEINVDDLTAVSLITILTTYCFSCLFYWFCIAMGSLSFLPRLLPLPNNLYIVVHCIPTKFCHA